MSVINTNCCIVGGGPAGIMTGFLLARAGIETLVIEKHADFFRDFRGDTVHPSTLELMDQLGLLAEFLQLPHQEVPQIGAQIGDELYMLADFSHLSTKCKFLALMPQWDFLNFLAGHAKKYNTFSLRMKTEATSVIEQNNKVVGVRAKSEQEELEIRSNILIGADGRNSIIRNSAGFEVQDIGAPMDVLWFRLSRIDCDPPQTLGRVKSGKIFIMLNRDTYWQCGFVIKKGTFESMQAEGIERFKQYILEVAPFLKDRVGELTNWGVISLLTVKIDRLKQWYKEGLLCIGDSAHAMSPIGGVGINLAIQDAVATANLLWRPITNKTCTSSDLSQVQDRRMLPTVVTQQIQVLLQNHAVIPALSAKVIEDPMLFKLMNEIPLLRRIPGYLIGIGIRPEKIKSPA